MSQHLDWRAVLEEHRDLLRSLERVEKLIQVAPGSSAPTTAVSTLRGEIYRLHGALERHFQVEESGFFQSIEADHPEIAPVFETLRREHVEVLDAMRAILDRALRQPEGNLIDDVRDKLTELFAKLRDHEQRETTLVQETVSRDLGVPSSS